MKNPSKGCNNCEHAEKPVTEVPCRECEQVPTNWTPKPTACGGVFKVGPGRFKAVLKRRGEKPIFGIFPNGRAAMLNMLRMVEA